MDQHGYLDDWMIVPVDSFPAGRWLKMLKLVDGLARMAFPSRTVSEDTENPQLGGFDQQCYQPLEGAVWECPLHAGYWTMQCSLDLSWFFPPTLAGVNITDDNQHLGLCSIILRNCNKYTNSGHK